MTDVFLLGGRRTAFQRRGGPLAELHASEALGALTAATLGALSVDPRDVDQALTGCVTKVGDQANNVGRTAWLAAGLPLEVATVTIDAKCGSSQHAVHLAAALVRSGAADLVVCNGIEMMSNHPLGQDVAGADLYSDSYRALYEQTDQGEAAERIADRWKVGRAACDEIALASQERAAAAAAAGHLAEEIVEVAGATVDNATRETSLAGLGDLKPVFRPDGVLTPGNSSQIVDGATCVVVCSRSYLDRAGVDPLARVAGEAFVGVDPVLKLTGPIPATNALLSRTGLGVSDMDIIEVNEAFASIVGAWSSEFSVPIERINQHGGAIALGHPVGATGARLLLTAGLQLQASGSQHALVTMCCGGGLGTATLLKSV